MINCKLNISDELSFSISDFLHFRENTKPTSVGQTNEHRYFVRQKKKKKKKNNRKKSPNVPNSRVARFYLSSFDDSGLFVINKMRQQLCCMNIGVDEEAAGN